MNAKFGSLLEKANAGDLSAMVKVGNALRNGNAKMSVDRNFNAGIEWLEKAANAGSAEAMQYLVSAYHRKATSGSYFNFVAAEKEDYWQKRLDAANKSQRNGGLPNFLNASDIFGDNEDGDDSDDFDTFFSDEEDDQDENPSDTWGGETIINLNFDNK